MTKFRIEAPDGKVFDVEGPEGSTAEQALAQVQASYKPEPAAPSMVDRGKAALGGINSGIAGLLGLPMDATENIVNLGKAAVGSVAAAAGRPDLAPEPTRGSPLGSEWIRKLMESRNAGSTTNPRPDDMASRLLHTGGLVTGGSLVPGASVKGTLAAATGGAVAGETLGPMWTGLGAMTPAAAGQAAANAKNAMAAKTAPVVETFKQAGTLPSVGQATDSVFLHGLENLAAKFPGGSGVMQKFIEAQQRSMGGQARTGVPTEAAGRAIEKGVTGEGGFLDRTRGTWQKLDQQMADKIGGPYNVPPVNTQAALDKLVAPTAGAEATTGALVNKKVSEIRDAFKTDMKEGMGAMPFEALRSLRSRVGSMLDDSIVSGIPNGELKQVYRAISKDLEAGAKAVGAGKEFDRQSNFYRARMDRIETVLDRVIGKGKQPEDIFKTFMPTDPDQANKARAVMRSLEPSERAVVSEAVANRLGRAKPGTQDFENEKFSSEVFLTNWNKLSPGAKAQLFPEPPLRENMERLARASSEIRSGKGIYANPSGTAGSFAAYSVYLSPLAAVAAGSLAPVVAAGSAAGSAFIGAKMMTSPKIVEWLATPVNPKSPQAAAHLARLGIIYNNTKDAALKEELATFIQAAQQ